MATNDERYIPVVATSRPNRPVPDHESLQELLRQIWMAIYKLEGRLGEATIRDSLRIMGEVSLEGTEQPPVSEVNEATIYLPNDGETGLQVSMHGSPYQDLVFSANNEPTIDRSSLLTEPYEKNEFGELAFWAQGDDTGAGVGAQLVVGEDDHPGIIEHFTGVVANNTSSSWWAGTVGQVRWGNFNEAGFVFKIPSAVSTMRYEVGVTSNPQSGWIPLAFETGNDMIYLHYDTNVDNAMRLKVRAGGVQTYSAVIVNPFPVDTWVEFVVKRILNSATYELHAFVNGESKAVLSTGLPADSVGLGGTFKVSNRAGVNRSMYVDLAYFDVETTPARWTVDL